MQKRFVLVVLGTCLSFVPTFASNRSTDVIIPLPSPAPVQNADNIYCRGLLGATLRATSNAFEGAGIHGSLYHATDHIVVQVADGKLYLYRQDEFEAGNATRPSGMTVVVNDTDLVATSSERTFPGAFITVFTLNRATGLASWTTSQSSYFAGSATDGHPHPRLEEIYLSCGARRQEN